MVGAGAQGIRAAPGEQAPGLPYRPFERTMRPEEAAEAAETPGRVSGLGHQPLSRSRNPLFPKRQPAATHVYKAESHLPGRCKALLHHKARLCFCILTAASETETRPREDNLYQRRRLKGEVLP